MAATNSLSGKFGAAGRESRAAAVVRNSFVCRVVLLGARSLSGRSSLIGRTVTSRRPSSTFDTLVDVSMDSFLGRRILGLAHAAAAAWGESAIVRFWDAGAGQLSITNRVRLAAWVVLVAALVRAAMDPSAVTGSRVALLLWMATLALAAIVFAAAGPIGRAWRDWRR